MLACPTQVASVQTTDSRICKIHKSVHVKLGLALFNTLAIKAAINGSLKQWQLQHGACLHSALLLQWLPVLTRTGCNRLRMGSLLASSGMPCAPSAHLNTLKLLL